MRISLIAGLNNESPVDTCIRDLAQARDEGFSRLWMTQMPYDADLLTVLAAALRDVPDIHVASGVVPIQNQHPMLLAQRALTLNSIAAGRFTLGIGVTHRTVTEGMWGISWDRSVRRLREYLDGLLPLLSGESVDAPGEVITTKGALRMHRGRRGRSSGGIRQGRRRSSGQCHRRRRRGPVGGRPAVRDVRVPSLLPRDARPRGLCGPGGCGADR